ncbi:MAG: GntR family transcriptional regulator [Paenibacillus sp.]|jgi:DNA-binding transcriptional MocR family regulator|nr:GntR family transcriptional regulator [Paenibacillus sp.]
MWTPDRKSSKPLYHQIADYIERRIAYGEFPPGSLLPSERKFASQLEVNRSTVVQAYDQLRAQGLIEGRTGSGTRVSLYKWGVTPKHTPNWRQYVEGGTFLPNLPFLRRIREEAHNHAHMIDFASGELSPDLCPNDAFRQLLQDRPFHDHLGYDNPQGYVPLRETLVTHLLNYRNIKATDSSILITSGSQQSLYLITQCLLSPGDAVAIEDPSYCYSLPMFQSAGLHLYRLPVDDKGVRPADVLELYRKHRIRMIFLNPQYQNPTGSVLDPARREQLLRISEELGIPIVEDDPFSLTSFQHCPPLPMKSYDTNSNVLYIGSLSKIAASGFRIGWMVAPQSVVSRLADARQQMDFGLSIVPQWLAAQYLASDYFEHQLFSLREALARRCRLLVESLREELSQEVSFEVPSGGLNLWCKLQKPVNDYKLLEEGIKRGVLFVPGSVYGSEPGFVRLSFARPKEEHIRPGVVKFAEALRFLRVMPTSSVKH